MTCCMYEFVVRPKNTTVIYLFIIIAVVVVVVVVVVITGTISTYTQANIKDFAL